MRAIEFPEMNGVFAKDQPQYTPLPVFKKPNDQQGLIVSKWTFSPEEFKRIFETGSFFLSMLTFNGPLQPLLLTVDFPDQENPYRYESPVFAEIVSKIIEIRKKQIAKGRTIEQDLQLNYGQQLSYLAGFLCYNGLDEMSEEQLRQYTPPNWNVGAFLKYARLPYRERMLLAAALLVAEIDRIDYGGHYYGKKD